MTFKIFLLFISIAVQGSAGFEAISAGKLPIPLSRVSVVYDDYDDLVYIFGNVADFPNDKVFRFNLTNGLTEEFTTFPTGLTHGKAGFDGLGKIYFVGAKDPESRTTGIWAFQPEYTSPTLQFNLEHSYSHSSVVSDAAGSMYQLGGGFATEVLKYTPKSNTTEYLPKLDSDYYGHGSVWIDGRIWLFGGAGLYSDSNNVLQYNPETGRTDIRHNALKGKRGFTSTVVVGEYVYILGGKVHPPQVYVPLERYNFKTGTSETLPLTNFPENLHDSAAIYDTKTKRIYAFGGQVDYYGASDSIYYIQL